MVVNCGAPSARRSLLGRPLRPWGEHTRAAASRRPKLRSGRPPTHPLSVRALCCLRPPPTGAAKAASEEYDVDLAAGANIAGGCRVLLSAAALLRCPALPCGETRGEPGGPPASGRPCKLWALPIHPSNHLSRRRLPEGGQRGQGAGRRLMRWASHPPAGRACLREPRAAMRIVPKPKPKHSHSSAAALGAERRLIFKGGPARPAPEP